MAETILVIDEGTTSTRAMLFAADGRWLASEQTELTQRYPRPGWVEHDAAEIWRKTLRVAGAMVAQAGGPDKVAAIGITNQRETIVFWDRETGEPLAPAIVWQDRRTADLCRRLRDTGHEALVQARTGLILDPYFSASKIAWAFDEWPQLREAGERLAVGTIESWLVWKLTGAHLTDAGNASRTALMALDGGLGRRAAGAVRRAARLPAGDRRFGRALCGNPAVWRGDSGDWAGRRSAGRDDWAGVSDGRRHQGNLWHRRVRADASGHDAAHLVAPAARDGRVAARRRAALCAGGIGVRRR